MSDHIKHECGIALIRLLKPLAYYHEKYGSSIYGLTKLNLMMEKQRNRGQDGAGVVTIKLDLPPGNRYFSRLRSNASDALKDVFQQIIERLETARAKDPTIFDDCERLKATVPFTGELLLGHLRYGTHGGNSLDACHPFMRQNNWMTRNLALAGNFNLTNVDELFDDLVNIGQQPKEKSDTVTVLEKIGHYLDEENERLYQQFKAEGHSKPEISKLIAKHLDIQHILQQAARNFDGGYAMAGLIGHGDAFVLRDPNGIRPAYFYQDDEKVVVASERPAIQTAFNVPYNRIQEIKRGHALIIKRDGQVAERECLKMQARKSCSFERIYFSRGSDATIYEERKELGRLLTPGVLEAVNHDLKNTVFSFIPNTSEVAFYGLIKGVEDYLNEYKKEKILAWEGKIEESKLEYLLSYRPRVEKIAIKDAKLRTFITEDDSRNDLVAHVYDITYGTIAKGQDTLVVVDDSIVRGTTLKESILSILDRLEPKKIIVVSSAPQIRYPDCYGIDMSKMWDFVAFRAAVALVKDRGEEQLLQDIYEACKAQADLDPAKVENHVKRLYEPFTPEEVSQKIAAILTPVHINAEVEVIYQTIDNLHRACPNHQGDWYFTGDYPTPGGNKVVNRAYVNFMEGRNVRAY